MQYPDMISKDLIEIGVFSTSSMSESFGWVIPTEVVSEEFLPIDDEELPILNNPGQERRVERVNRNIRSRKWFITVWD